MARKRKDDFNDEDIMEAFNQSRVPKERYVAPDICQLPALKFKFKNDKQKEYNNSIKSSDITFCLGPAGVGKSAVALHAALELLKDPNTSYNKIIITRPIVESYESLGFLPGDVNEKIEPYLMPLKNICEEIIGDKYTKQLFESNFIRFQPIAYCRGLNFRNCIVLVEESQNLLLEQIKLLITRISDNCKMIFSGDTRQNDINKKHVVFEKVARECYRLDEVGLVEFNSSHVVRHPLIEKILPILDEFGD